MNITTQIDNDRMKAPNLSIGTGRIHLSYSKLSRSNVNMITTVMFNYLIDNTKRNVFYVLIKVKLYGTNLKGFFLIFSFVCAR